MSAGKKVIFATIPLVALLGLAEVVLRVTGASERCRNPYRESVLWECDPLLYFKLSPNHAPNGQPLNRDGFRTHEFTPKAPGTYRILALGDSCTFGVDGSTSRVLRYVAEPYPQRLERIIAERSAPGEVEVLNAALPGYNSFQGLMLLRTKLRGLDPDLITVRFGWNDSFMQPEDRTSSAFREWDSRVATRTEDFLLKTALYRFVLRLRMEMSFAGVTVRTPTPADLPTSWTPGVPVDQYKRNLRRIAEVARAQSAEVWFLTSPHAFLIDANRGRYDQFPKRVITFNAIPSFERLVEIHETYDAATREVGAELGVLVVDMAAIYSRHAAEPLLSGVDVLHPTQAGHNLEAEVLYEQLAARGVLPDRTREATGQRANGL